MVRNYSYNAFFYSSTKPDNLGFSVILALISGSISSYDLGSEKDFNNLLYLLHNFLNRLD